MTEPTDPTTDADNRDIIIIRRTKSVTTLRTIAGDHAGSLQASDAGELRETADAVESGARPSWMRQMWTLMLLRSYFFP